jgi:hypothetical protein
MIMRRLWKFLTARLRAYDLFPEYIRSIKHAGWDVLWAPVLPSVLYTLWWFLANPPWWITLLYVVWLITVTGYFVWRLDHIRLMPKLGVGDVTMAYSGTGKPNQKRIYVQIPIQCVTEGSIRNCRGQLLRVFKWVRGPEGHEDRWELTHIAETLDLWWSMVDEPILMLEHGADRRLDVFFVENTSRNMVIWTRLRPRLASAPSDRFKFDVRIAGDDCLPMYISLEVVIGDQWHDLTDLRVETTKTET